MNLAIILVTCSVAYTSAYIENGNDKKCEIFLPLIDLLKGHFQVVAMEVDGFVLGTHTRFTSVDDQARKVIEYINKNHGGSICCAYGLSLGGKILSRVLERDEVKIEHSILDECKKVYPFGGTRAVLDGYKSVYTTELKYIPEGLDIHYWHGTQESFVAKPQAKHLESLCPDVKVEVFKKMNHGQLLIDYPEEIAKRIIIYGEED